MQPAAIEQEARRLQFEVWHKRELLFPHGVPPLHILFDPAIAARVLELDYQSRESIPAIGGGGRYEAAGTLDRARGVIAISRRFKPVVQRYTGAHELGHFTMHPHLGERVAHRDLPIGGGPNRGRSREDEEADYFAACFLAPRKAVIDAFKQRFLEHPPLRLDECVAFHLYGHNAHELFIPNGRERRFAAAVAGAQKFGSLHFNSMASQFGLSTTAMAIRLRELKLTLA